MTKPPGLPRAAFRSAPSPSLLPDRAACLETTSAASLPFTLVTDAHETW